MNYSRILTKNKVYISEKMLFAKTAFNTKKWKKRNRWLNIYFNYFLRENGINAAANTAITKTIIGKPVLFFLVLVVFSGFFLSSLTTFVVVVVVLVVLVVVSSDESSSVESVSSSELVSVALSVELLSVELLSVPLPAADWSSEVWPFVLSD